jgi:phosphatidate cytidylyltransferase
MLLPRVATAAIGVPIFIGAIYLGSLPFLFVIMAIILLGLREFYFLAEETGYPAYKGIGVVCGAVIALSVYMNGVALGSVTENQATSALLAVLLIVIVVKSLFRGPADTSLSEWAVTFFGVFYVAWSLGHLLLLRDLRPQGLPATFLLFAMIWTEDICAYFVGVKWGRHLIAQQISPKKTWEGTIFGVIGAMAVAALFQLTVLRSYLRLPEALALALVTSVLAFASDLGESVLKRGAGMKDSSPLLPGHGGVLDRFDSFILTAPVYYYYWAFLKH